MLMESLWASTSQSHNQFYHYFIFMWLVNVKRILYDLKGHGRCPDEEVGNVLGHEVIHPAIHQLLVHLGVEHHLHTRKQIISWCSCTVYYSRYCLHIVVSWPGLAVVGQVAVYNKLWSTTATKKQFKHEEVLTNRVISGLGYEEFVLPQGFQSPLLSGPVNTTVPPLKKFLGFCLMLTKKTKCVGAWQNLNPGSLAWKASTVPTELQVKNLLHFKFM